MTLITQYKDMCKIYDKILYPVTFKDAESLCSFLSHFLCDDKSPMLTCYGEKGKQGIDLIREINVYNTSIVEIVLNSLIPSIIELNSNSLLLYTNKEQSIFIYTRNCFGSRYTYIIK